MEHNIRCVISPAFLFFAYYISLEGAGKDGVSDFLLETLRSKVSAMLSLLFLTLISAFTDYQANVIRASIIKFGPKDAVFHDVVMNQNYAHTDIAQRIVSIDARRFDCCPNTFSHVVQHELAHCAGRMHNSIPGDIMNYSMPVTRDGTVIDDV